MYRFVLIAAVLVLPAFADETKPTDAALKGKWEVTAASFDGAESAKLKGRILLFKDGEFTTFDGEVEGRTLTFTLNPKAKPREIDLDRGTDGVKTQGIYQVEKDELKLCYAEPKAARPTRFESAAGSRTFLLVMKRVKD